MGKTKVRIDEKTKKEIEQEFLGDPALQQIHLAQKLISREAKEKGLSLQEYIKNYSLKQ